MSNITTLNNTTNLLSDDEVENSTAASSGFREEELIQYGLYTAGRRLLSVQIIVCCAIGLPSNIASFITLLKMKPMTSSIFFLTLLAVVDFFVLFYKQLFSILIADLQHRVGDAGCKLYFYIGSILVHYSIWLMVALTVERFIAVWFPLKVSNICTVPRAIITSACIWVVLSLFNIPYAVAAVERQLPSGRWNCGVHPMHVPLLQKWVWVDSTIYLFLSWPTLLFCNVMIIAGLRISSRRKQQLTNSTDSSKETNRQQQSITIMLITASLACFILLTPNAVFFIYEIYWDYKSDIEEYVSYIFFNSLVYFLSNFNHAINFWLYVISGKRFRSVFISLITCRSADGASRSRASGTTAVSTVSSTYKPAKGVENGGFTKDDEKKA